MINYPVHWPESYKKIPIDKNEEQGKGLGITFNTHTEPDP